MKRNGEAAAEASKEQKLRPGWRMVRFGDVVREVKATERHASKKGLSRCIGIDDIDSSNLRIRRWGVIAEGTSFTRRFDAGQVLFPKRRVYQRKVAVADFPGICSGDILVLEPKGDELNANLLPFIVQSEEFVTHALTTSAGSLSPRTKFSSLATFCLPLPCLDEQRKVADFLWNIEHSINGFQRVVECEEELIDAMLEEFLLAHRDATKTCAELLQSGPSNGISPPSNSAGKGYPTLSIGAIRNGKLVAEGNLKYAELTEAQLQQFRLIRGDLLIVRGNGNRDLVGRCGIVSEFPENCFYPDLLIRVGFDADKLRSQFACLQWNARAVRRQFLRRAKSTNGIWKINGADIRAQRLVVPPITAQDDFLQTVSLIQGAVEAGLSHIDMLRKMKRSVIDGIFGE